MNSPEAQCELVHVLMPVRDAMPYLEETLADLLAQEGVELRIWAIDDGSSDGGREFLERRAGEEDRLELLDSEGQGTAEALETGRRAAAAEGALFMARMDADDRCSPRRIKRQLCALKGRKLDAIGCRVSAFGDPPPTPAMKRYLDWQNGLRVHGEMATKRFLDVPLMQGGSLFRAAALEAAGGWNRTPWAEDLDLWFRFFAADLVVGKLSEPLYRWRVHDRQATRSSRACSSEMMRRGRAHHLVRELGSRGLRRIQLVGTGASLEHWKQALLRADGGLNIRTLSWNPRKARAVAKPVAPPLDDDRALVAVMSSARVRRDFLTLLPDWAEREGLDFWFVG